MKRYTCSFLLCFFGLFAYSNPVFAQGTASPVSLDPGNLSTSCDQLVSPDSAFGFVRILEKENNTLDIMQVNVEIEFQIADYEPCFITRTTPTELHLPEKPFLIKMSRQEGQNQFQFSIHRKRLGPIVFMKEVNAMCLQYDETWQRSTWC